MRNVLVAGSRGIGLAISEKLAGADFVIAVARRESGELRAAIGGATQGNLHFRACDLSAVDGLPAFVKSMRDEFGAIYGLVNNAGIGTEGLLATMHNSDIEALVRLNVLSPVILTKYVVRHMMSDGEGRIVNISSIIASTGYNGLSVYGATKAAATGFTRSLAREVGKLGITVNAIAPGFIETRLTAAIPVMIREVGRRLSALGQGGLPGDIGELVTFLASPGAQGVTGQIIRDCGGALIGA